MMLVALSPSGGASIGGRDVGLSDFLILVAMYSVVSVVSTGLHVLLSCVFSSPLRSLVTGLYAAFLPMSTVFWMSVLDGPPVPGGSALTPVLAILAASSALAGMLAAQLNT
ncbi:MAG: hypothetical protein R6U70_06090 [Bacillota bacterium]